MYALVAVNVVLVPLLLLIPHVSGHPAVPQPTPPWGDHGVRSGVLLVVALLGTTVAPWQLFFQQSAVVDKRITPRWMGYARLDTLIGTVLMLAGAAAVIALSAAAFSTASRPRGVGLHGLLSAVSSHLGAGAGDLLAVLIVDGALLGAAAIAMATSYAIGDVTGARHSLHRSPREAPLFYAVATLAIMVSAGVALLPGVPLGLTTTLVQVLAGLLLPSASIFLLLLCNDTAVLGPWSNGPWLNAVAATSVAGLLALSAMLVVTTLFPAAPAHLVVVATGGLAAGGLLAVAGAAVLRRHRVRRRALRPQWTATPHLSVLSSRAVMLVGRGGGLAPTPDERAWWRTPPLAELRRPVWSTARVAGMAALRAYLVVSVLLLAGRMVASALGH